MTTKRSGPWLLIAAVVIAGAALKSSVALEVLAVVAVTAWLLLPQPPREADADIPRTTPAARR